MGVSGIETPDSVTVTSSPCLIKHFAKGGNFGSSTLLCFKTVTLRDILWSWRGGSMSNYLLYKRENPCSHP